MRVSDSNNSEDHHLPYTNHVPYTNVIVLHATGAGSGDTVTLSRQLRRGGRQSMRRARFQGQVAGELPAGGWARGREAVVRERCAVAVATTAAHDGVRAVSRGAESTWLLPVALPCAIWASLLANVAYVRRRASAPSPRRRAWRAAAKHVRPINQGESSDPIRVRPRSRNACRWGANRYERRFSLTIESLVIYRDMIPRTCAWGRGYPDLHFVTHASHARWFAGSLCPIMFFTLLRINAAHRKEDLSKGSSRKEDA